jgi:hypothetical protein
VRPVNEVPEIGDRDLKLPQSSIANFSELHFPTGEDERRPGARRSTDHWRSARPSMAFARRSYWRAMPSSSRTDTFALGRGSAAPAPGSARRRPAATNPDRSSPKQFLDPNEHERGRREGREQEEARDLLPRRQPRELSLEEVEVVGYCVPRARSTCRNASWFSSSMRTLWQRAVAQRLSQHIRSN